ncbi:MAG TPA: hypothetical protein VGW74_07045 [Propionibacteriaceae bacterium]|nr:hypothetical protein [Propionibacteriaceae bacterium]
MTMLQGPTKGTCGCTLDACDLFGTLGRPDRDGRRHVRGCGCPVCRGRRNRRSGQRKQRVARKALGVASQKFSDANEETWADQHFANEVKSGKQCGPVANWWRRVEAQVLANEADHGDRHRPVRAVAMPEGWGSDGLVVVRLSTWRDQIGPALDEFYGSTS